MVVQSIAMFLPALPHGGAERVAVNLANEFAKKGIKVIFVLQQAKGDLIQELPPGVNIVELRQKRTLACVIPLMRFLNREKPDILLSHLSHNNIVAIWAGRLARSPTRIVVVQHNSLARESRHRQGWQYKVLPLFYRLFLRYAHGVIAVSDGVAEELARISGLPRHQIMTMHGNPLRPDFSALRRAAIGASARRLRRRAKQPKANIFKAKLKRRSF